MPRSFEQNTFTVLGPHATDVRSRLVAHAIFDLRASVLRTLVVALQKQTEFEYERVHPYGLRKVK